MYLTSTVGRGGIKYLTPREGIKISSPRAENFVKMRFHTLPIGRVFSYLHTLLISQEVEYMVYLTKRAGKYKILSRVRVKITSPRGRKGQKYLPERPQAAREGIFMNLK